MKTRIVKLQSLKGEKKELETKGGKKMGNLWGNICTKVLFESHKFQVQFKCEHLFELCTCFPGILIQQMLQIFVVKQFTISHSFVIINARKG